MPRSNGLLNRSGARAARRTMQGVVLLVSVLLIQEARAQTFDALEAAGFLPSPGILRNSVANLHAQGDSLWVGPFLNLTTDGGATWEVADADSLRNLRNRVYSLDVEGDVIWAGLALSAERTIDGKAQNVDVARGFVVSDDGGETWQYRTVLAPSDNDPNTTGILDLPEDTTIVYGDQTLPALAITVPETSPPWDVDYDASTGTVWTANQNAGIRKSTDQGRTWQRVVMPPDTTAFLSPELGYTFPYYVQPSGIPLDQFAGLNFQAFAVLVDAGDVVWTGTVGGLNRSTDGGTSWRHYDRSGGLLGNWVISIEEQRLPGRRSAIWATNWPAIEQGEQFGVVVTRDGGETFETALEGQRIYDFGFRGETVYAAGENGLFISDDGGTSWRAVRDFYDPSHDRAVPSDVSVFSVATTDDALWVGTSDGLFRSTDGGATWRIFRAEVPLDPDQAPENVPRELVPRVDTYAYPNPFSRAVHEFVRIRYDLPEPQSVHVRIFDFGMNLVRDLSDANQSAGAREVTWDGTDDSGGRVANGTYFYAIETSGETVWGKIMVLE